MTYECMVWRLTTHCAVTWGWPAPRATPITGRSTAELNHQWRSKGWLERGARGESDCAQSSHLAVAYTIGAQSSPSAFDAPTCCFLQSFLHGFACLPARQMLGSANRFVAFVEGLLRSSQVWRD